MDGRVEQAFLLLARDPPIAHGLRLHVQPDTEAVEGGLVDERRRLRLPPADGCPQERQHLVHRGDLHLARVLALALEAVDDRRLLERFDRQAAEVPLQNLEAAAGRVETADASRFQVALEVGVEKPGHVFDVWRLFLAGRFDPRIAPRLDLADEQAGPITCFFKGLDGPLFARLHPWNGEVVHRHAIPDSAMPHVEPQMLKASPAAPTRSSAASPDAHTFSFTCFWLLGFRLRDSRRRSTGDPIANVPRMKAAASYAEPLRDEQSSQVGAANCLLVAADELGDLESSQ
jgi:hypothetical protein